MAAVPTLASADSGGAGGGGDGGSGGGRVGGGDGTRKGQSKKRSRPRFCDCLGSLNLSRALGRGRNFAAEEPELDRSESNFRDENPIRRFSNADNKHINEIELPPPPPLEHLGKQPPPVVPNVGPAHSRRRSSNSGSGSGSVPPPPPNVIGAAPPPQHLYTQDPRQSQSLHRQQPQQGLHPSRRIPSVHSVRGAAVELRPTMPTGPSGSPPSGGGVATVPVSPGERQHSIDANPGISSLTPQRPSLPSTAAAMLGSRERSPPPTMPPPPHMQMMGG